MRAAKKGTMFAIYATLTSRETTTWTNILAQYKEFQDIFEKKYVDIYMPTMAIMPSWTF
jgi:hypothetical protein